MDDSEYQDAQGKLRLLKLATDYLIQRDRAVKNRNEWIEYARKIRRDIQQALPFKYMPREPDIDKIVEVKE